MRLEVILFAVTVVIVLRVSDGEEPALVRPWLSD